MSNHVKQVIWTRGRHTERASFSKSGSRLNWLLDIRPVLLDRSCLEEIAYSFWDEYKDFETFQVGTIETAAVPLLAAILLKAPPQRKNINGFVIRKERKTTGLGNNIEGILTNDPIVLVDDILNSGSSIGRAVAILEAEGRKTKDLFVVVDFHSRSGMAWRNDRHVTVRSMFSLDDFDLKMKPPSSKPPHTREIVWHTKVQGGVPFHVVPKSAPVIEGKYIYKGCDAGIMQAFDAATGLIIWEFRALVSKSNKGIWSTPAVHEGRIYFGAYNGSVYCLDAFTGKEIWSQSHCEWIGSSPLLLPHLGMLYIGLEYRRPWAQGGLAALRMEDGEKVWERTVSRLQHGSPSFWEEGNLVVWGSADHETLALRPETGDTVWTIPTNRSVKYAAAIDQDNAVASFASFDRHIYVADLQKGSLICSWETNGICYTTPLIHDGKIFCGSADRKMYIGDVKTKNLVAVIETGARIFSSPKRVSNRIIFGTAGGKLIELDDKSFEVRCVTQLPDAITNEAAIDEDGGVVYVTTSMNDLFALRLS